MLSHDSSIDEPGPMSAVGRLKGRRILLVEDSPVVGPFTAELLGDLGCVVVGPAPNMAAARELAEGDTPIDAAMMDVHIRGERVFPLCDSLASRGVPFVLTSGYADWQMPDKWEDRPRLNKPYTIEQVEEALTSLLGP
jgi:CheY-like chemotaxis protein